jgi:hypothetical protein
MASNRVDWSILRSTLVVFVVALAVASGMVSASFYFRQNMEREYQANHAEFREASLKYLAVDDEERIIAQFLPEFQRLYDHGLLGRERRLSWLETLRRAGDANGLPQLVYKLDAQRIATPDFGITLGDYQLYASAMTLNLGLLHEGDLLQLLQTLDREALGQYSVKSCWLKRTSEKIDTASYAANLSADCTLDWWTINLGGERGLKL